MSNFNPIVTVNGRAKDNASRSGGAALVFANVLFGDGGGSTPSFSGVETALVNQCASMPVSSASTVVIATPRSRNRPPPACRRPRPA